MRGASRSCCPGARRTRAACTRWCRSGRTVDAKIVGVAKEIDLALLKIDAAALPALPIVEYDALRQGELVFAFGRPEALRNSVTWAL